jgi:hypothetical protein
MNEYQIDREQNGTMQYVVIMNFENRELFLMDAFVDAPRLFERKDIAEEIAKELGGYVLEVPESDPTENN